MNETLVYRYQGHTDEDRRLEDVALEYIAKEMTGDLGGDYVILPTDLSYARYSYLTYIKAVVIMGIPHIYFLKQDKVFSASQKGELKPEASGDIVLYIPAKTGVYLETYKASAPSLPKEGEDVEAWFERIDHERWGNFKKWFDDKMEEMAGIYADGALS